jgi:hypothetical protein
MAEGHSCPLVSNAILISYSWAMDKFRQAIDRIYRLNSVKDVTVWSVLCDQTIDAKLESNIRDKADASDLVLDGKLLGETPKEENFFELLEYARLNFDAKANTVDDAALQAGWPALRMRLAAAQKSWDKFGLEIEQKKTVETMAEPPVVFELPRPTVSIEQPRPRVPVPVPVLAAKPLHKKAGQPVRPPAVNPPLPVPTPLAAMAAAVEETDPWARRLAWRRQLALAA